MVAPILLIFLRTNEHTGQLLAESNALWLTEPKFWVGHGHATRPCCSTPMRSLWSSMKVVVSSILPTLRHVARKDLATGTVETGASWLQARNSLTVHLRQI